MTYQEIFNNYLKTIRLLCKARGCNDFGDTLVGVAFDFSDELKDKDLIKGDNDNGKNTREY